MRSPPARRVLLTRSREDNETWAALLRARGFDPVALACIETAPRPESQDELLREVAACDWIALCSRRAVRAVGELCGGKLPERLRVACVGPATAAEALRVLGRADRVAPDGTGRALGAELAASLPRSARVLIAAAQEGRVDVEEVLRPAGLDVRRVAVYRTLPAKPRVPRLRLFELQIDAVFFASPSAVQGLLAQAELAPDVSIVALGPTTAAAARAAGLNVDAVARVRGLDGLIEALERHLATKENPTQ